MDSSHLNASKVFAVLQQIKIENNSKCNDICTITDNIKFLKKIHLTSKNIC